MEQGAFKKVAATPDNPNWEKLIARQHELYARADDIRSPFARDYTRILHSMAYRRLKHKTQVFFNIEDDHICTRMEHVSHVESVSSTIASRLGLNPELTKAIATGHDLGHAPFGHQGETVIGELTKKYLGKDFWHEQNGLRFVDSIELLKDYADNYKNLDLTYAVRDGIISHCGEVEQNGIFPRSELVPLTEFDTKAKYQPATWEGCLVKVADKIAYFGRDIEDAVTLGFLDEDAREELKAMARVNDVSAINTTVIVHNMIISICENSSPDKGILLDERFFGQMRALMDFNIKHIYRNPRLTPFVHYSELVINEIFAALADCYDGEKTLEELPKKLRHLPKLSKQFPKWLAGYCDVSIIEEPKREEYAWHFQNEKIYRKLETKELYIQAVIDYISGMTDRFAISVFNEMLKY